VIFSIWPNTNIWLSSVPNMNMNTEHRLHSAFASSFSVTLKYFQCCFVSLYYFTVYVRFYYYSVFSAQCNLLQLHNKTTSMAWLL